MELTSPVRMAIPTQQETYKGISMACNSEGRIAELGKLLKGKIRTDWVLLDEVYRESFDELMALLQHRDSVVACIMHQAAKGRAHRERKGRIDVAEAQAVQ